MLIGTFCLCATGFYDQCLAQAEIYQQRQIISIAEAKVDRDSNYIPDKLGDTVIVGGRVSVAPETLWSNRFQIAIQDTSAGMFIFNQSNKWPGIKLGDSLQITGVIDQYRGLSQIIHPEIVFVDTIRRKNVNAIDLDSNNLESSESMLVTVVGQITNISANSGGNYISIAPSEGSDKTLEGFLSNLHNTPNLPDRFELGETVKITGLLIQHDYSEKLDGSYQILPRNAADLKLNWFTGSFYLKLIGSLLVFVILSLVFNVFLRLKVKQQTKKLNESTERFSKLAETTSSIILIYQNNRIVYANQAAENITGMSRNDFLNQPFPEEILNSLEQSLDLSARENFRSEIFFPFSNGKNLWFEYSVGSILWNNKEAAIITAVDITAKKHSENELERSEKRFESMANVAPVGIFRTLPNGYTTYVNPKWTELSGISAENALGDGWLSAVHPEDRELLAATWNTEKHQNKTSVAEYRFLHIDGREVAVLGQAEPEFDANNKLIGFFGTITDITERKKTEISLRNSEEKFRNIFENHSAIKLLIDPETGAIVDANFAAAKFYGWSQKELKKMKIQQINLLPQNQILAEMKNVKTGKSGNFEFQHRLANGNVRDVEVFSSKVNIDGKDFLHSIIQDITEKKKLYDELLVAKEKAEESDRLKTSFLNNISHEIRTPMNGILGLAELLKMPGLSGEEKEKFIGLIDLSGRRMINTISDIVEISKIETGQVEVTLQKTNLNGIINEVFKRYKPEAEAKNLELNCRTEPAFDEVMIVTDEHKLSQTLKYLVNNAIKFTREGAVNFGYEFVENHIRFYVKDTGIGLTDKQKEIVFQRFMQGSNMLTRNYEGVGLGLSISLAYVEMLGGKFWVESELEKGSVFFFEIPITEPRPAEPENKGKTLINGKAHVLLVDDEPVSLMFLNFLLQQKNLNILEATNGKEALEIIKSNPEINLVIMDLKLPVMDGFEATKQIKLLRPELPVIAQTAFAFPDDKRKAKDAGCDEVIIKPVIKELFFKVIANYIPLNKGEF